VDTDAELEVPDGFRLGVSTSAFQTEGASSGRGESIWDRFLARSSLPPEEWGVATDHLARLEEDLDLAAGLGVSAYRFSLSWTRLMPAGKGRPRREGLAVYDRMLDEALARGLEPWACLYHWDLPQALQERGGWRNRDTAYYLADYAEAVADLLAGRARRVFVLNEPNVHAVLGHLAGRHAPGLADLEAFAGAVHHQNLATGLAAARLREALPGAEVGTIVMLQPVVPAEEGEDHEAAAALADAAFNRAFLDPLFGRGYPEPVDGLVEALVREGDMAEVARPPDVLGVNYYTRLRVRADPESPFGLALAGAPAGAETTAMGWEVYSEGLREVLVRLRVEYGGPRVAVTECGAAYRDEPQPSGRVDDWRRARFLLSHLRSALAARAEGCDVDAFLVWTLVDNLEWTDGFARRYGLVRLEPGTLRRVPKLSYEVLREVATSGTVPPAAEVRATA
jgi:beta-glucosidase